MAAAPPAPSIATVPTATPAISEVGISRDESPCDKIYTATVVKSKCKIVFHLDAAEVTIVVSHPENAIWKFDIDDPSAVGITIYDTKTGIPREMFSVQDPVDPSSEDEEEESQGMDYIRLGRKIAKILLAQECKKKTESHISIMVPPPKDIVVSPKMTESSICYVTFDYSCRYRIIANAKIKTVSDDDVDEHKTMVSSPAAPLPAVPALPLSLIEEKREEKTHAAHAVISNTDDIDKTRCEGQLSVFAIVARRSKSCSRHLATATVHFVEKNLTKSTHDKETSKKHHDTNHDHRQTLCYLS